MSQLEKFDSPLPPKNVLSLQQRALVEPNLDDFLLDEEQLQDDEALPPVGGRWWENPKEPLPVKPSSRRDPPR